MDKKWIQILVILLFYQTFTSGVKQVIVKEGEAGTIKCSVDAGSMVMWFRVLDKHGMEFIASFGSTGMKKAPTNPTKFQFNSNVLTLTSFKKHEDSGMYSCAAIKSNELKFGEVTQLVGVMDPVTAPAAAPRDITTQPCPSTTTRPCSCTNNKQENPSLYCPLVILGPLAGACGLLLLLLIITTLYCNKMRTRRCPHHHKKRPRTMAPGKQMMTNRHV